MKNAVERKEETPSTEYMGYSLFNEVDNSLLQAWNRANVAINIKANLGVPLALNYMSQFDHKGKMQISAILAQLSTKSYEQVYKEVQDSMEEDKQPGTGIITPSWPGPGV